jgi:hypothetical protein
VKRRLFQYFRGVRRGTCVLILAFLILPYIVDVAYYGDLTPTHYAQENLTEGKKVDLSDARTSLLYADDQEQSIEAGITLQDAPTTCRPPVWAVFPPQYLLFSWCTSRPPPAI